MGICFTFNFEGHSSEDCAMVSKKYIVFDPHYTENNLIGYYVEVLSEESKGF